MNTVSTSPSISSMSIQQSAFLCVIVLLLLLDLYIPSDDKIPMSSIFENLHLMLTGFILFLCFVSIYTIVFLVKKSPASCALHIIIILTVLSVFLFALFMDANFRKLFIHHPPESSSVEYTSNIHSTHIQLDFIKVIEIITMIVGMITVVLSLLGL